jgi:hypothetical protein
MKVCCAEELVAPVQFLSWKVTPVGCPLLPNPTYLSLEVSKIFSYLYCPKTEQNENIKIRVYKLLLVT